MCVQKLSALALVAVAASISLTACDGDGGKSASSNAGSSASSSASNSGSSGGSSSASGQNGGATTTSGSGSGSAGSGPVHPATCQTDNLDISASTGMAEGEALINFKNTGAEPCTMHGYAGVDLKGKDGTVSASRRPGTARTITLAPGQATHFDLHYPANHTGGSGVTFRTVVVTPPGETHSKSIPAGINIPADSNSKPAIYVDPVGADGK